MSKADHGDVNRHVRCLSVVVAWPVLLASSFSGCHTTRPGAATGHARILGVSSRRPKGVAAFEPKIECSVTVIYHGAIKRMTKTCPAMLAAKSGVNWSGTHASIAFKMDSVIA